MDKTITQLELSTLRAQVALLQITLEIMCIQFLANTPKLDKLEHNFIGASEQACHALAVAAPDRWVENETGAHYIGERTRSGLPSFDRLVDDGMTG